MRWIYRGARSLDEVGKERRRSQSVLVSRGSLTGVLGGVRVSSRGASFLGGVRKNNVELPEY
jgi:hypothetical protein